MTRVLRSKLSGMRFLLLLLAVLPAAGLPAAGDAAPPALATLTQQDLQELLPALRKGGYIFYFRHALTRQDQEDRQPVTLGDCTTQRNLSEEGRHQAGGIGAAMRDLKIPVGKVLSSPFCRCVETAQLAFGKAEIAEDLYFAIGLAKAERAAKGTALRRLLAQAPAAGSNAVIVAHTANLDEATGYWPKPEGAAVLFRPDGAGSFRPVGRLPPEIWGSHGAR